MKKLNLPNKLTLLRLMLVPFFTAFMLINNKYGYFVALLIYVVASFTDFLDGKIARSRGLVTDFGKFLDPIADKVLVLSALVCLIPLKLCSPVVVIIVLAREFIVSSLRLIAASNSIVIAAGKSGKVKTAAQMITTVTVLALLSIKSVFEISVPVEVISNILMWATSAIVVYSGTEYLWNNRQLIKFG